MPQHELLAYGWHGAHQFYKSKDKSVIGYPKPLPQPLSPYRKTDRPPAASAAQQLTDRRHHLRPVPRFRSTLLAAARAKRRCIGIERSQITAVVIERFQKLTGIDAEVLPSSPIMNKNQSVIDARKAREQAVLLEQLRKCRSFRSHVKNPVYRVPRTTDGKGR